jgi:hypothetical protein
MVTAEKIKSIDAKCETGRELPIFRDASRPDTNSVPSMTRF